MLSVQTLPAETEHCHGPLLRAGQGNQPQGCVFHGWKIYRKGSHKKQPLTGLNIKQIFYPPCSFCPQENGLDVSALSHLTGMLYPGHSLNAAVCLSQPQTCCLNTGRDFFGLLLLCSSKENSSLGGSSPAPLHNATFLPRGEFPTYSHYPASPQLGRFHTFEMISVLHAGKEQDRRPGTHLS